MPNPIKYSTGSESLALKKGNFYIGTGDVGKGPSNTTGYYNGVSPSSGGYVIYMNKSGAPGDLSYHNAANDSELISFTNNLAGQSFTSATQCLVYYAGQTDKVVLNRDYDGIVTSGLVLNLDAGFTPSYPTSGTSWYDVSSGGNNGSLINGPTFNSGSGGSIVFDGTDDYVDCGTNIRSLLQGNPGITFEGWYNLSNVTTDDGLFTIRNGGDGDWFWNIRPGGSDFWIGFSTSVSSNIVSITNPFSGKSNVWIHIVTSFISGALVTYINGVVVNTTTYVSGTVNITSGAKFTIGNYSAPGTYTMNGKIGSFRTYNRNLSSSEVLQNYRVTLLRMEGIVTNGLFLYLDAGLSISYPTTGTTWYDLSGNNLNGTLTNGPTFNSGNGGSIVFDGTDDYISIILPSLITVSSFTYNVWFYADSVTGAYRTLIDLNNDDFLITITPEGNLSMWDPTFTLGFAPNANTWYNIQVSHNYNEPYYTYINGELKGTHNDSKTTTHTVCNIGIGAGFHTCSGRGPDEFFDGKISIASMYNRGLSATEVLQNFNAQKGRFGL